MKIRDEGAWQTWRDNNTDPYGGGVIRYAEAWADLMEARMAESGGSVGDVAKDASHDADTEGITGFMYGAAVATLASVWEHGEELRRWHNLDTQLERHGLHHPLTGASALARREERRDGSVQQQQAEPLRGLRPRGQQAAAAHDRQGRRPQGQRAQGPHHRPEERPVHRPQELRRT